MLVEEKLKFVGGGSVAFVVLKLCYEDSNMYVEIDNYKPILRVFLLL